MVLERSIVTAITRNLQRCGAKVINITVGENEITGTPDLIGSYRGRTFVIEVKNERGEPTRKQLFELNEWAKAGAIAILARSWEYVQKEVIDVVDAEWANQS